MVIDAVLAEQQERIMRLAAEEAGGKISGAKLPAVPRFGFSSTNMLNAFDPFGLGRMAMGAWAGQMQVGLQAFSASNDTDSFSLYSDREGINHSKYVDVPKRSFFEYLQWRGDDASHMLLGGALSLLAERHIIREEQIAEWINTSQIPEEVMQHLSKDPKVKTLIQAASTLYTRELATDDYWQRQKAAVSLKHTEDFFRQTHASRLAYNHHKPEMTEREQEAIGRLLSIFNAMVQEELGDVHVTQEPGIKASLDGSKLNGVVVQLHDKRR